MFFFECSLRIHHESIGGGGGGGCDKEDAGETLLDGLNTKQQAKKYVHQKTICLVKWHNWDDIFEKEE